MQRKGQGQSSRPINPKPAEFGELSTAWQKFQTDSSPQEWRRECDIAPQLTDIKEYHRRSEQNWSRRGGYAVQEDIRCDFDWQTRHRVEPGV
jgi:hypothetical protein